MGTIGLLAQKIDPVLLAKAVDITPDPWQERLLRSRSPRILLNCCRQSGKSTMAALLAAHTALYQPGSLVLVLSPTLRQSQELFRKIVGIYRALDRPVPAEAETKLSLELDHGSRIVSLPGKESTIRGFSAVRLLVIDEAARVPDDLYASVRPMLAVSNGRLIALSTPFGTRGWWFEAWRSSEPWERFLVPATECPRISPEFLEEERRNLGEWWFRQEYLCEFLDAETQLFSWEDVQALIDPELEAWQL